MHTSRLPEATLKEPATLPGGRNKAFWRSVQAFCPLRTSILPAPYKHSARSAQAICEDGASTVDGRSLHGGRFRQPESAFPASISSFLQKACVGKILHIRTFCKFFTPYPYSAGIPLRTGKLHTGMHSILSFRHTKSDEEATPLTRVPQGALIFPPILVQNHLIYLNFNLQGDGQLSLGFK